MSCGICGERLDFRDQICFFDIGQRDLDEFFFRGFSGLALLFDGSEVDRQYAVSESGETALPLAIFVDRSKCLEFDEASLKTGEVLWFIQLTLEPGRGDFEGLFGPWDEVFYVEDGAEVLGESGTIFMGYAGEQLCGDAFWKDDLCCFRCGCFGP